MQHTSKSFLLEACPAAGKTRAIVEVAFSEHAQGKAEAIVMVVPFAGLKRQAADDFNDEMGMQLNPNWAGGPLIEGSFKGAVVTYAWVSQGNNAATLKSCITEQPTFVVLDEIHHASEESTWGIKSHEAFDGASKILLTTGTPFRSDGIEIPWVDYYKGLRRGIAKADYSYTYGMAISEEKDKVVRYIHFLHHGGEMTWVNEQGRQVSIFEERLNRRGESERLRTALVADTDMVGAILEASAKDLRHLRENGDPDAAWLIIGMGKEQNGDTSHIDEIMHRVRKEHGIIPVRVVSEDPDAGGALDGGGS